MQWTFFSEDQLIGTPTNINLFKNIYKNIIMWKQSIYICLFIYIYIYVETCMSSSIKDTSYNFGSDIMCCVSNAAAHVFLYSLCFYLICTPQAAALSQNTRKAVVQQTFSRIFFPKEINQVCESSEASVNRRWLEAHTARDPNTSQDAIHNLKRGKWFGQKTVKKCSKKNLLTFFFFTTHKNFLSHTVCFKISLWTAPLDPDT